MSKATYQQIIDLVQDCVRRMQDAGESHRMLARWISEGIDALSAGQAQPGTLTETEKQHARDCTQLAAVFKNWMNLGRQPTFSAGDMRHIIQTFENAAALVPPAVPGEVETATTAPLVDQLWPTVLEKLRSDPEVSKHVSGWLTDHIWSALAYALREHHDRHALPEIERGDKGDGWQPIETAPKDGEFLAYGEYLYPGDKAVTKYTMIAELTGVLGWPFETAEGQHPTGFFSHWHLLPAAPSASIEGETK